MTVEFDSFEKSLQFGEDTTEYVHLTSDYVSEIEIDGKKILKVAPEGLRFLAKKALEEVSFKLRPKHLKKVAAILKDPEASDNDRFVAKNLLDNAVVAVKGELPSCQDTGTGIVLGKKGQFVWTEGDDEESLSAGIFDAYTERNLRYSQNAPLNMFDEVNTGNNLPSQIDILAEQGNEYKFLFLAKGGGSANKTYLFQETKALLNPAGLEKFVSEKLKYLGTSACPPYHISLVIGGTSAETVMKLVKLGSAGYLDSLPTEGSKGGRYFRDLEWEEKILEISQKTGIGAQFGGKYFAHDVKVFRGPRHGASCPVGLAVSCSADRNIKAKITAQGLFLEKLEDHPEKYLEGLDAVDMAPAVQIDLNQPMSAILAELSKYPIKTRLSLNGSVIVARDIAHAKIKEMLDRGEEMPDYLKNHPVYYAGPAKTPEGMATGSFGPTTAGRMDSYVNLFQSKGGSMVMLAKGNRSQAVTDACAQFGGFYLGSIGGPAAILAQDNIKSVELVAFPELGMEAVRKITVENFPAFIICDDKGNNFFADLT